jgi:cation-transporting ATPase 13A2
VETGLDFLGFLIMQNKLKPVTTKVIKELNEANIRTIMATGDNVLTAISVARECNIIQAT